MNVYADMTRTLSELGFASREALIVVPHRQGTRAPRGQSSSNDSQNGVTRTVSSENTGGYFDYAKRILSYVNPFSYLGGNSSSANSETAESDGLWQYREFSHSSMPFHTDICCIFKLSELCFRCYLFGILSMQLISQVMHFFNAIRIVDTPPLLVVIAFIFNYRSIIQ